MKSEIGSSIKSKLTRCPPDITSDQEEIDIPSHPTNNNDHKHDDPHNDNFSDDTPSDEQEPPPSEKESSDSESSYETGKSESEEETDSEAEIQRDIIKSKSSEEEESESECSRGSSYNPSNEKPSDGSNHGDETKPGPESDSDDPFREPEPGPSQLRRSSRVPKPAYKSGNVLQTWHGLLHYEYLTRWTGPVIFLSTYLI